MKSFKQFITELAEPTSYGNITEELNDDQKNVVDSWNGGARAADISAHVIPPGQDKISIPMKTPEAPLEPHPEVEKHLNQNGYEVSDYRAGLAKDKYGRDVKIGKVLGKTGASPQLMNTFNNDPKRAASKANASGLHIVISRHPHDVAGMSTNQGWKSCMTMGKTGQIASKYFVSDDKDKEHELNNVGSYSHYLKPDVEQGTHVAYLAHANDPDAKRPLARIALKPFEPEDKTKPVILRPENKTYGTTDDAFGDAVRKWSEKNFPVDKNTIYEKNKKLYNDDYKKYIADPETLLKSSDSEKRKAAFDEKNNVSDEIIHKGLKDKSSFVRMAAVNHPNAKPEHYDEALKDPDVKGQVASKGNLRPDQIDKLLRSKDAGTLMLLTGNKKIKLNDDQIEKMLTHKEKFVRVNTIANNNNKLTPQQLDRALNDKEYSVKTAAIQHGDFNDKQLSKIVTGQDPNIVGRALLNKKINAGHLMDVLSKRPSAKEQQEADEMNNGELGQGLNYTPYETNKMHVLRHDKINSLHLDEALKHDQPEKVRMIALEHKDISETQLQNALKSDPSIKVRKLASKLLKEKGK